MHSFRRSRKKCDMYFGKEKDSIIISLPVDLFYRVFFLNYNSRMLSVCCPLTNIVTLCNDSPSGIILLNSNF